MSKYQRILEAAQQAEASLTGKLGFAFYDLQEGKGCYLHENEVFPTASVYKVYILAELYRQAAEGKFSLDEYRSTPLEAPTMGSGILSLLSPGLSMKVRDHAKLMMMLSDNLATDIIFDMVGSDNIKANVIDALGLTKTKADYNCDQSRMDSLRTQRCFPQCARIHGSDGTGLLHLAARYGHHVQTAV